jgi:hypothetical protein
MIHWGYVYKTNTMQTKTKRTLYHVWIKLRSIEPSYLFVLLAVFVVLGAIGLRSNYETRTELLLNVREADKYGGDVEAALRELRQHVYAHMNTSLQSGSDGVYPPIQLEYTYNRLVEAGLAETKQASEQVYSEAQAHCERLHPESYSGGPRVPCIREYVSSHGVATKTIPDGLYKFDFVSPRWSSDLAGWSIVGGSIVSVVLIIRLSAPQIRKRLRI